MGANHGMVTEPGGYLTWEDANYQSPRALPLAPGATAQKVQKSLDLLKMCLEAGGKDPA